MCDGDSWRLVKLGLDDIVSGGWPVEYSSVAVAVNGEYCNSSG